MGDEPFTKLVIAEVADDIRACVSEVFDIGDFRLEMSASIGVARFPQDTTQGLDLLKMSQMALYDAQTDGGNRVMFFDANMQAQVNFRVSVTERLRVAVRNGEIIPHYQSQHALSDGRLVGLEALARWTDSELGSIGPDVFIPIAEKTGLIVDLGEQILRRACEDAARWERLFGALAPVVSVNISPSQFARTDVAELVARTLSETGLAPNLLEIEVTEGVLIDCKEKVSRMLEDIANLGVSIALDDFGTGYSSLSYLKELRLHRLKIDRSFVKDMHGAAGSPIVSTIIQLGHELGLTVFAEGVETEAQLQGLMQLGCEDGQGYLYSRAMPIEEAHAFATNFLRQTTAQGRLASDRKVF